MRLLRYPSAVVQVDALTGMVSLARQKPHHQSLEELLGLLHVLILKPRPPNTCDALSKEHSAWLLRCLGKVSARQSPSRYSEWCHRMRVSASFQLIETDYSGQQMQSQRLGMLKVHTKELLSHSAKFPKFLLVRSQLTNR